MVRLGDNADGGTKDSAAAAASSAFDDELWKLIMQAAPTAGADTGAGVGAEAPASTVTAAAVDIDEGIRHDNSEEAAARAGSSSGSLDAVTSKL